MSRFFIYTLLLVFVAMLSGCAGGYTYTLHTDTFPKKRKSFKKVVCLKPEFRFYTDSDMDNEDFRASLKLKKTLVDQVRRYSKNQGFNYVILDGDSEGPGGSDFYNRLLPLRRSIMQAIRNQENPLNEINNRSYSRAQQLFVVNTLIPAELSQLSQEYGTPYFAIYDVYTSRNRTYMIHIIADVNLGRIEYQELKRYNNKVGTNKLAPLVYDSFLFLNRSLKKD